MDDRQTSILSPDAPALESFTSAAAAVDRLEALYTQATRFLSDQFLRTVSKGNPAAASAPLPRDLHHHHQLLTRSTPGLPSAMSSPGTYATTVTRPDLFRNYLIQQIELLIRTTAFR
jgi:AMP nucleosidase